MREDEIQSFFEANRIGDLLFYNETLMKKYGQPHKIPSAIARRSKTQTRNLLTIKKKLQDHIERKGYTLDEFIAVIDKNGNKEISVSEFEA